MGLRKHHYKVNGDDGIAAEIFQIIKDDAVKMLNAICQKVWKTQQWLWDWKKSVLIPIPKKGNGKEFSNYLTIALIPHADKVMLKILQARLQLYMNQELQQYINHELLDVLSGFRKGRGSHCQHLLDHRESKGNSRKTSASSTT